MIKIDWSEHIPPNENISYDHVIAITPFGKFEITWKGWKDRYDYLTVDETPWGDCFGSFSNLDGAKEACEKEYERRLQMALNGYEPRMLQLALNGEV